MPKNIKFSTAEKSIFVKKTKNNRALIVKMPSGELKMYPNTLNNQRIIHLSGKFIY